MKDCCEIQADLSVRQRRVLEIALAINAAMFAVELVAGLLAHSTALLADSVDMLGDAMVYGFSLYVVARQPHWQARAAMLKGFIMLAFGLGVLIEAVTKVFRGTVPSAETIGLVGILALAANAMVLAMLSRHRADDINMRSVWLCSRNDVIANIAILIASVGVRVTDAAWPDISVGVGIALLFSLSAAGIVLDAARSRHEVRAT